MRRLFLKIVVLAFGAVVVVAFGAVAWFYSLNRREVRIAQNMMADASRLQIEKSTLNDVLAFVHKYNGEASGSSHDTPCSESDCLVTASPDADFLESHPKFGSFANRISRRRWHFIIFMWIKGGKLTAIEQWFGYSTPKTRAFVITSFSQPTPSLCRNPFFRLHHTFAAYPGPKHFAVWVDATATREREMLRLNLDCALSISGCNGVAEMVPMAWARYESDRPLVDDKKRLEAAESSDCR
jgi:hypothetical protein